MKHIAILTGALIAVTSVSGAQAGGLCGKGGLFRGSVGAWCDKHIEGPITTPLARQATVAGGRYLGGAIGGPIGGQIGGYVGGVVNERFAGQSPPVGRPYQYPVSRQVNSTYPSNGQYQSSPPAWPNGGYQQAAPDYPTYYGQPVGYPQAPAVMPYRPYPIW